MTRRKLLALWMQLPGITLFLLGFFPLKTPLHGTGLSLKDEELIGNELTNLSMAWKRRVGQVVIVVIDALRADFVYDEAMLERLGVNYNRSFMVQRDSDAKRLLTRERVSSFSSFRLLATASSPTVTLPRVKAISTGNIPGYVDIILNFGSQALLEDSLIRQWRSHSREIIFFGDDTWLNIFPGSFIRSETTSSFFVSDFYEVDNNVTRNLPPELPRSDWDVMILHYLGLDHIGHVFGPSSPLIPSKLEEMEGIIETLVLGLEKKKWKGGLPPLVLILGDHGMADMGGHGGSTLPETLTPVLALSPLFQSSSTSTAHKVIRQTDLATTLSWLTGVPIPINSMGVLIGPLVASIENSSQHRQTSALYNLRQVRRILSQNSLLHQTGSLEKANGSMDEILAYVEFLQTVLFDNVLEYNYGFMVLGILIILSTILWILFVERVLFGSCQLVVALHALRLLSLASTSFIEEEHQVVYFLVMSIFLFLTAEVDDPFLLVPMILYRAARTLNQTGNKWGHLPDVSLWLKDQSDLRCALFVLSMAGTCIVRAKEEQGSRLLGVILIPVLLQKVADGVFGGDIAIKALSERGVTEATVVYWGSLCTLIVKVISCKYLVNKTRKKRREIISQALVDFFLPLAFLLNRPENAFLFFLSTFTEALLWPRLRERKDGLRNTTLVYYLLGLASFFHQGNCSSRLSKLEISSAYVGVTSYSPFVVGPLLLISTYSGPILWLLLLYRRLEEGASHETSLTSTLLLSGTETLFYLILSTLQRFHLFVWSVFAPKLLYLSAHLLVSTVLTSLLSIVIFRYA